MPRCIPVAVQSAIETWAAQKRQLYLTTSQPLPSIIGKIKSQQSAAGEGDARMRQKWPEVYTGDGWRVQLIVQTLRELPRMTLTYHYLLRWPWKVPVADQADDLGIPKREYWRQLDAAELAVDTGLQVMEVTKRSAHSVSLSPA